MSSRRGKLVQSVGMWRLFLVVGLIGGAWAQSDGVGPMKTVPPLSEVFPMVETSAGVEMAAPVLLNLNTIIPIHAILRVCYVRPQSNNSSARQILGTQGFEDGAMSRQTEARTKPVEVPPEVREAIRVATKTVWPTQINFRRAFDLISGADMRLVYLDPKGENFVDEIFNLPDGLLLTEQEGQVEILAVESLRSGETAGFVAGDQIVEVGGKKLDGTLASFVRSYLAAQTSAEQTGARKVVFKVQRKGESDLREISVTRPPSLKGSLLDLN